MYVYKYTHTHSREGLESKNTMGVTNRRVLISTKTYTHTHTHTHTKYVILVGQLPRGTL